MDRVASECSAAVAHGTSRAVRGSPGSSGDAKFRIRCAGLNFACVLVRSSSGRTAHIPSFGSYLPGFGSVMIILWLMIAKPF